MIILPVLGPRHVYIIVAIYASYVIVTNGPPDITGWPTQLSPVSYGIGIWHQCLVSR